VTHRPRIVVKPLPVWCKLYLLVLFGGVWAFILTRMH
jgi:hypothetical protein